MCLSMLLMNTAYAGDFGWMHDMTVEASGDLSRFHARLAARFHIGDVQINAVLGKVSHHADAYMVLRLHELSGLSIDVVLDHYHEQQGKGWGALAKSLGIKPGSAEFHRLKQGHDLDGYSHYQHGDDQPAHGKGNQKDKSKGKGNAKHSEKGKGK